MHVQARALRIHLLIFFDEEHKGQTGYQSFVVMSLIVNVVLWINSLYPHPNIHDESSMYYVSPKYNIW